MRIRVYAVQKLKCCHEHFSALLVRKSRERLFQDAVEQRNASAVCLFERDEPLGTAVFLHVVKVHRKQFKHQAAIFERPGDLVRQFLSFYLTLPDPFKILAPKQILTFEQAEEYLFLGLKIVVDRRAGE